jgi:hypothetical protein
MEDHGKILRPKVQTILPSGYSLELDATPYCNDEEAEYFQQQIGVLRWAVELGRIDLTGATSMMASYTAAPLTGHLVALFHMFSYLKCHDRSKLVFDDSYVQVNDEQDYDWKGFYPNVTEEIPTNIPKPRGKAMQMTVFVDADHAGDVLTRRLRTGVLVYLNRSPILWYSKKQNSVETSPFGSEFIALKTGVEIEKGLRYKLRMMGIPLEGDAHVRVDNMSVVKNTSVPESTLKK